MVNTACPKEKIFVPVECEKAAMEEFSLQDAMEGIKEINIQEFKENIVINEIETLNVLETLLDDFSCVDLKKEVVDLRNFVGAPHNKKSFKKRIINLLNTDVSAPLGDLLNTDISTPIQELMAVDFATPLQEVFDNLITMISTNKHE